MRITTGVGFGTNAFVYDSSVHLATQAIVERLLHVQRKDGHWELIPKIVPKTFSPLLHEFKLRLLKRLQPVRPLTDDQFVGSYVGKRRIRYEEAVKSLEENPISAADFKITGFIKGEVYVSTAKKPWPCPRLISPRSPRANVVLGKFLKPAEKPIFLAIARSFGSTTVLKGYNSIERATILYKKFNKLIDPVVVMRDFTRLDAHVHEEALAWSHGIYNQCFAHDRTLRKWLRKTLVNHIRVNCPDGVVKVTVEGKRMSGDMDTSLGNCLLVCGLAWSHARQVGVKLDLGNDGDDCADFIERRDLEKYTSGMEKWYADAGFTLKLEGTTSTFEQIDFCKCRPVFDGVGYRMVRTFPQCIEKDLMSVLPINGVKAMRRRFADIGNCGRALSVGIPVLSVFYETVLGWSCGSDGFNSDPTLDTGMQYLARGLSFEARQVTERSRYSFYLAFGVTPAEQIELEEFYRGCQAPLYDGTRIHFEEFWAGHDRRWVAPY